MDNLTRAQRRKNMQNIRSINTKPELALMKALRVKGIKFIKHVTGIIGKPDIVIKKKKLAVFIDSDFWHGNPKRFVMPKSNIEYWSNKIARNRTRDKEVNSTLKKMGWMVVRLWEHDVMKNINKSVGRIIKLTNK